MFHDRSMATRRPCGRRSIKSPVRRPLPHPASIARSSPRTARRLRTFCPQLVCGPETLWYAVAFHSVTPSSVAFVLMSFPATRLSVVERTRSGDEETRRIALSTIIDAYWKPAYKYLRVKWSLGPDEAADLTQEFFTSTLEKEVVEKY